MVKPHETSAPVGSPAHQSSSQRANGTSRIRWAGIRRRARSLIAAMPAVDDGMKESPYAVIGVAAALGLGVGILLGSRVMRAVVASVVSYAMVEAARTYFRERPPVHEGGAVSAPRG